MASLISAFSPGCSWGSTPRGTGVPSVSGFIVMFSTMSVEGLERSTIAYTLPSERSNHSLLRATGPGPVLLTHIPGAKPLSRVSVVMGMPPTLSLSRLLYSRKFILDSTLPRFFWMPVWYLNISGMAMEKIIAMIIIPPITPAWPLRLFFPGMDHPPGSL